MTDRVGKKQTASQRASSSVEMRDARNGTHVRQDRCLELWRAKLSFPDIAFELGYSCSQTARNSMYAALRRHNDRIEDLARDVREDQMAKLALLEEKFLNDLLDDDSPDYKVMDALMRLYKRKAELVGADSAMKLDVVASSAPMTEDQIIAFIERCEKRRVELEKNAKKEG